jgi:Arc/MetJ family transcription regulator
MSLLPVPEMTSADGAAASANTDQAGPTVDEAPDPPARNTNAADTPAEEAARPSESSGETGTDVAGTGTAPPLTLIERRAPDGGACRDVLFGAAEPRRITRRLSRDGFAPSSLPGLCALTLRWDGRAPARIDLPDRLAARLLRSDLVSIKRLAPGETLTLRLIDDARPTGPYRFGVESDGTVAKVRHRLDADASDE